MLSLWDLLTILSGSSAVAGAYVAARRENIAPFYFAAAILAGFRAALSTIRGMQGARPRRARGEDEDALFV